MRFRNWLPLMAATGAMIALVFCPETAAAAARDGLRLCAEMLVPSLLPFFVLSGLLRAWGMPGVLGRLLAPACRVLWGADGAVVSAFLMGILGGYPLGAAMIGRLRADGALSREEGERALAFCCNTGPAFLLGAAGMGVFHSRAAGFQLYGAHVLAAVIVGMLVSPRRRPDFSREQTLICVTGAAEALTEAVEQSVHAMLTVCGFAVLFSVAVGLLGSTGYLAALGGQLSALTGLELTAARAFFTGLLEIGGGLGAMRGLQATGANLALCAFMVSFGGVAVWCQTLAMLRGTDLTARTYLPGKLLHGTVAAGLILLINS